MTLWNHGEAPQEPSFTCPACGAVSHHPMDVRYGYCGRCHDFTGDPTDFIFHVLPGEVPTAEQEAFSERVRDQMHHRMIVLGEGVQITRRTPEEYEALRDANREAFESEERLALTIINPRRPRRRRRWYDAMVRAFCLSKPC